MENLNIVFDAIEKEINAYINKEDCKHVGLVETIRSLSKEGMFDDLHSKSTEELRSIEKDLLNNNDLLLGMRDQFLVDQEGIDLFLNEISVPQIDHFIIWNFEENVKNKLFSINQLDRKIYAKMFAQKLDSKLYCCFYNVDQICTKGYITYWIEKDLVDVLDSCIDTFAEFDIDLVDYLIIQNDFTHVGGDYTGFRHNSFMAQEGVKGINEKTTSVEDYLINCDKSNLISKLEDTLKGRSGNDVAIVLYALIDLEYTTVTTWKTLFDSMKERFSIKGGYNATTEGKRLIKEGKMETNGNKSIKMETNAQILFNRMLKMKKFLKQ